MTDVTAPTFSLTADQQAAKEALLAFLCDPNESIFVLSGFSGCGKSTLVTSVVDETPGFLRTARLIQPSIPNYTLQLTATTNKAAENLAQITGMDVVTIQSFLELRVVTDFKKGTSQLVPRTANIREGYILYIDEGSFVDPELLRLILKRTKNCKIIFVGDPAQLLNVGCSKPPVFSLPCPGASLSQVVRQAKHNPIVEVSTMFRHTVNTGEWPQFTPDGHHVQHLRREDFNSKILAEFTRPDWKYSDSKILAWTNKCAIAFNAFVREHTSGNPQLQVGDYAVCNCFVQLSKGTLKTDQLVHITGMSDEITYKGVPGRWVTVDSGATAFMPNSLAEKNARLLRARKEDDINTASEIDQRWIDLRAAYACTVNKAQGSTYDRVFIDLDDISRCNSGDQIARMLYVAVSRARDQVFLTGDVV